MKVYVGEQYEVLDSGIVIGNPLETITIEIDKRSEFFVYFQFTQDFSFGGLNPTVNAQTTGKNGLILTFSHYSNSKGHGNVTPLEIGNYGGRVLYLNYRIFGPPGGDYQTNFQKGGVTLMYTWLLGEKIK